MDSLTQITLGAAVGEIVLGRKIGNRAVFWGGVGGTIPDLDVMAAYFLSPIRDLAFHRGFSHSISFAVLGALVLGFAVWHIYQSKYHKYIGFVGWMMIPLAIFYFLWRIFDASAFSGPVLLIVFVGLALFLYRRYFKKPYRPPGASMANWQILFFWAFLTHILLDCFTTYGTQVFQPFSSYRVAFCTISVADPIYTFPFLICVIALTWFNRENRWRRILAFSGIGISSIYLLFTVWNKSRINDVWRDTLQAENIEYTRIMTSPTILNNVLWYCVAETKGGYYHGLYSLFDEERKVNLEFTARNEDLLKALPDDPTLSTLQWFSNGYYTITQGNDRMLQFNDLRFGVYDGDQGKETYIFHFPILRRPDGYYDLVRVQGGPPPDSREKIIAVLWERIKGI